MMYESLETKIAVRLYLFASHCTVFVLDRCVWLSPL